MEKNKLEIKLVKSPIGYTQNAKRTLIALGLTKMNKTIIKNDSPHIKGMINKVNFLVQVKEVK